MYHHVKKLMYSVRVEAPDPRFGNMLLEQFRWANGETASIRSRAASETPTQSQMRRSSQARHRRADGGANRDGQELCSCPLWVAAEHLAVTRLAPDNQRCNWCPRPTAAL
jgi:manganese containing catalase